MKATLLFFNIAFLPFLIANPIEFKGEFNNIVIEGSECEGVFAPVEFRTKHFRTGSGGRTSVLYFSNDEKHGFFHGQSLVGLYGYNNDFRDDKRLEKNGRSYYLFADGIVDYKLLLAEVYVEVKDIKKNQVLCTAQAEYTGFR